MPALTNMCETAHKNVNELIVRFNQLESMTKVRHVNLDDNSRFTAKRHSAAPRVEMYEKSTDQLATDVLSLQTKLMQMQFLMENDK